MSLKQTQIAVKQLGKQVVPLVAFGLLQSPNTQDPLAMTTDQNWQRFYKLDLNNLAPWTHIDRFQLAIFKLPKGHYSVHRADCERGKEIWEGNVGDFGTLIAAAEHFD